MTTAIAPLPDSDLTFHDDFTTLDRSSWAVQTDRRPGADGAWFADDPRVVSIAPMPGGSALRLAATRFGDKWLAGQIDCLHHQTYGRFEVRATVPLSFVGPGFQTTFWLWPVDMFKHGYIAPEPEIDFAEFYTCRPDSVVPYVHYPFTAYSPAQGVNDGITGSFPINPGQFHTYGVDWRPGELQIYVDGQVVLTNHYVPTRMKPPAPFDSDFFLTLTQTIGRAAQRNAPGVSAPNQVVTLIDYVKVWK